MILRYELKKVFSKKINRIVLIGTMLAAVVFSMFAIGGVQYTDGNGTTRPEDLRMTRIDGQGSLQGTGLPKR